MRSRIRTNGASAPLRKGELGRLVPGQRAYHTTAEAAAHLRCSARTVRDWINHGCPTDDGVERLNGFKRGRKTLLIPDEELWDFEARIRPTGGRPDLDPEDPVED